MDPKLIYTGPFAHPNEVQSARWMLLFPLDEFHRLDARRPEPGDLQAMRAAVVQGMLEGLPDAFTWRDILARDYPED